MINLLAILGRGIQKTASDGPWVLTEDLEVLADDGAHSIVRLPIDDRNPNCVVGGGELNLMAGLELCREYDPKLVVCAYGHRARYLVEADAPTESEIMSARFVKSCKELNLTEPEVVVWPKDKDLLGPSNTKVELLNILRLALEKGCLVVGIVTVTVHLERAILFTRRHLASEEFVNKQIEVEFFASEQVLTRVRPETYALRTLRLFSSEAFRRNALREANGVEAFLSGSYTEHEAWRPVTT